MAFLRLRVREGRSERVRTRRMIRAVIKMDSGFLHRAWWWTERENRFLSFFHNTY
jgi:hypothetical protein